MRWLEVCIEAGEKGTEALCALLEDLSFTGLAVEDEADLRDFMENDKQYWDYIDEDFIASRKGVSRVLHPFGRQDGSARHGETLDT